MNSIEREAASLSRLKAASRKSVWLSFDNLVKTSFLDSGEAPPLIIEPDMDNLNPVIWARNDREYIESQLLKFGAILFRNFDVSSPVEFKQFAEAVTPDLLDYRERAAPRTQVLEHTYTSTEFPSDQYIPLHHEMSYSHNWPTKLSFYCDQPAQSGGCTPIADDRKVFKLINPRIKQRFVEKKVMYIRNYGEGVDLSWQEAFQTNNKSDVEAYCRKAGMTAEWRDGDRLRTRSIRQALATHPKTGETVWFNHAHMFHVSNLQPAVREALLAEFKEDELPRNAFYGDGSPIESSVAEEIRETYRRAAVSFPWRKRDILLLDNFLISHGREPFRGPRRILVTMAEMYVDSRLSDCID